MEILEIELWDPLVEFRRDLRDAQFYQQVIELLIGVIESFSFHLMSFLLCIERRLIAMDRATSNCLN